MATSLLEKCPLNTKADPPAPMGGLWIFSLETNPKLDCQHQQWHTFPVRSWLTEVNPASRSLGNSIIILFVVSNLPEHWTPVKQYWTKMEMLQSPWAAFQMLATHMDTSLTSFFLLFNPANSILHISNGKMFDVCYLNKCQGSYKGSATGSACDGIRIWKNTENKFDSASWSACCLLLAMLFVCRLTGCVGANLVQKILKTFMSSWKG